MYKKIYIYIQTYNFIHFFFARESFLRIKVFKYITLHEIIRRHLTYLISVAVDISFPSPFGLHPRSNTLRPVISYVHGNDRLHQ